MGNLHFETKQHELETLFAEVGPVASVAMPADRDTGRPRGFAFVEFTDEASALHAIEKFDGYELQGRTLRVNMAEEQRDRSRSFGGGSFGDNRGPKGRGKSKKPKGSRRHLRAQKRGY